jgi:hypothetical protein
MPIKTFIEEGLTMAAAARNYASDLNRVGAPPELADHLEVLLTALSSAQARWNVERRGGRDEETIVIIAAARALAEDLLAAGDLALRDDRQGQRNLAGIREREGIPDLIADLTDLAVLLTEKKPLFEAIHLDVETQSRQAAAMREKLQTAHAEESVNKGQTMDREIRDRIYTLAVETAEELRAYGTYAFKKDKTDKRGVLFTSDYSRERMRKHRARQTEPAPNKKDKSYFSM